MAKEKNEDVLKNIISMDHFNTKLKFIKTGIDILDAYMAGEKTINVPDIGLAVGKIIGIAGPNGVGKSTLMLDICKRFCKQNYKVLYLDVERGLNIKSLRTYGLLEYAAYNAELEFETSTERIYELKNECLRQFLEGEKLFYTVSPRTYTQAQCIIRDIFNSNKKGEIKLIVIDSIKDLIATKLQDDMEHLETQKMMIDATSQEYFLIALKDFISLQECVCVVLNQFRISVKGQFYINDEAGSNAWKHRTDIRIVIKEREKIKQKTVNNMNEVVEKQIGNFVELEMRKGRFGNPFTKLLLPLIFGSGVSMISLYSRKLEDLGYIKKKGAGWTTIDIPELEINENFQGESKRIKVIKENFNKIHEFIISNGFLTVETEDIDKANKEVNFKEEYFEE